MGKRYLWLVVGVIAIALVACRAPVVESPVSSDEAPPEVAVAEEVAVAPEEAVAAAEAPPSGETVEHEIKVTPDGVKYIVDPGDIVGGGPPKDGIPSIDAPKFVSVEEADAWIEDNELVLAIIYKGVTRVYPLQIMVWHEIVNESIGGDPILITY